MKKILCAMTCLMSLTAFQGCFWHSTTEKDVEVPSGQSTTTVVTPPAGTTTTTTNQ